MSALCDLPRTKHEPQSFTIDLPFSNNSFALVVVNGVYRELYKKQEPLRAFCRTFYIVPQGEGFVIVNDILVLTNATVRQIQAYAKPKKSSTPGPADRQMIDVMDPLSQSIKSRLGPMVSNISPIVSNLSPIVPIAQPSNEAVIQQFMSATHMNRSFSQQCLAENSFDMKTAYDVFQKLKSENLIPSEAFVH